MKSLDKKHGESIEDKQNDGHRGQKCKDQKDEEQNKLFITTFLVI